jgi:hypothetical protein
VNETFPLLDEALESRGAEGVFEVLTRRAREQNDYRLLFETRILQIRHDMGLPLIETNAVLSLEGEQYRAYETRFKEAAREAGDLYLAAGDIPRAWPYFQALGSKERVAEALERYTGGEDLRRVIEIAFQEEVNQQRGFELILANDGVCRAITLFGQIRSFDNRQHCLGLLVRRMHADVISAIRETISGTEGSAPEAETVAELIRGRDWLFEGNSSYIDSTHLTAFLRFTPELEDSRALRQALDLAEYGTHLSEMFHFHGEPPFEDTYGDHAIYLRALLGQDEEAAVAHFRNKAAAPSFPGDTTPAEVFIDLLVRLRRYGEAIDASLEYLPDAGGYGSSCPSVTQLCQMAGDFHRLREIACRSGNLTAFAAAVIQDKAAG